MLQTYIAVVVHQMNGTAQMIDPNINEIKDLIERGYLVAAPELGQSGANVVVRAVENPANTPANLATQLGLGLDVATEELAKVGKDISYAPFGQAAVAAPAPTPMAAPAPVEQAQVPNFAEQAPAAPAAPQFTDVNAPVAPVTQPVAEVTQTAPAAPAAAFKANEAVELGLNQSHQVVATAETKAGQFEIEVGVPFIKKAQGFVAGNAPRRKAEWTSKYPFSDIANAKIQAGISSEALPSFHLASTPDKKMEVKNISNDVKRASEYWEAQPIEGSTDRVTFRALSVGADDPKGEGVRIYAIALSQAPARRTVKKKKAAGNVA